MSAKTHKSKDAAKRKMASAICRRAAALGLASVAFIATAMLAPPASAADTPLPIPGVRTMHDIAGAQELPDPKLDYKIVFDVQTLAEKPTDPSDALEFIAGLMNTFSKYGVPADHMHFVAVFHGKTIVLVANDSTYAARMGGAANPNKDMLNKLAKAGVQLVVCGQSALAQHYSPSDLLSTVHMNLSATVTFINLQLRGYVRLSD